MIKTIALISLSVLAVVAHVRVRHPPARGSIWRDPAFAQYNPPIDYNDDSLYCGRVHQQVVVGNCGVCGDPADESVPRSHESGGTYGVGIIAGRYSPGQVIPLEIEFTTTHLGFIIMQLCDRVPETEDCFRTLTFADGSTEHYLGVNGASGFWVNTSLQLPSDVRCSNCVLRLNYRAGNNWGNCGNGTEGMGCGLQETFRNCIDIAIE